MVQDELVTHVSSYDSSSVVKFNYTISGVLVELLSSTLFAFVVIIHSKKDKTTKAAMDAPE